MLRRRRPFRHQEDIAASSVAANRPVSAAVSFPQIEPPPSNPFAIFPNEVTQHIFQFFNNSELPVTVNRQFLFNANEVKKMRAHYFFKRYLENQLDLDMATTGKILSTLKTICDYSKFCITSGMSPAEKQARQAVLLLMTMQIMEHSTRNDIVRYLLPRGVMQPIILPDGDGDFNVIEEHTPISSQEVADYKCLLLKGNIRVLLGPDAACPVALSCEDLLSRLRQMSAACPETVSPGFSSFLMFCAPANPFPKLLREAVAHTLTEIRSHTDQTSHRIAMSDHAHTPSA
ncbi:hypothetical protein AQUSIP_01510 [Aquicella siphonis]|uniref:F-box domain-containing protein n=1 Tax=Aquicella siphonis TaxID=254247 RepID=A0A5E4PEM6_9COXI|nr:hypothetical protein [Aquicella siphonis]VVC74877.1 hypothetical protein AQUSIP_01510 [Aquicella siphonis]